MSEKDTPVARGGRRITALLGPTNTGKTHFAVERMLAHRTGMIGLPLRLLAREVYDHVVAQVGVGAAALVTGEEKIIPAQPRFFVCTVEAMPVERRVEFLAIDEIQLCADPERGHVFTDRLLRARGDQETMFLGADTMRPLIRLLVPDAHFISRTRFSDLTYTGPKKLSRLPRRSAVVAFSADAVYGLAEAIRSQRGGAAVVMGALSPRTRNAQVALYQSGEVDFLVATDAIGMGLNMDVDHVAFASLSKFDGETIRPLRPTEVAQIAGRAGRHMNDGTFGPTGEVPPFEAQLVEQIEQHRFDPVRVVQWRNPDLQFTSLEVLIRGLEVPPPAKGLVRARNTDDVAVLKILAQDPGIAALAASPPGVRALWDVCQVPDFRKVTVDEHAGLVGQIFRHLMENDNRLPTDWVAAQVERIDVAAGDIDTLSARLAQIRIWTYVSHRSGWLEDAAHWQERTRAIEDALSDALHEALTQRFIDRRTSLLMKRLAEADDLVSEVDADGEVTIEGEYVGRLIGFVFVADPRGQASTLGPKTLRHAGARALAPEIASRAQRLSSAAATAIQLSEHGKIWWEGAPVAKLVAGAATLVPRVELIADDFLAGPQRERVQSRLELWVREHIAHVLAPLAALASATDLDGLGRGLAYQVVEQLGSIPRAGVGETLKALDQPQRAALRRYGVRFGAHSVFLPVLLKPAAAQLKVLLWAVAEGAFEKGVRLPAMPAPGLVSVPIEPGAAHQFYERAGFRPCGARAVRLDMLERLADMLRPPRPMAAVTPVAPPQETPPTLEQEGESAAGDEPEGSPSTTASPEAETASVENGPSPTAEPAREVPVRPPGPVAPDGSFTITPDMMSIVGASGAEFEALLRALGYRARQAEDGKLLWRLSHRREGARPGVRGEGGAGRRKRPPHAARQVKEGGVRAEIPLSNPHPDVPAPAKMRPGKESLGSDRAPHVPAATKPKRHNRDGRPRNDERRELQSKSGPRPARSADKPIDPNSPFAKLAVLKEALTKGR